MLVGLQRRPIYFPFPAQVPAAEAVVAGAREVTLRTAFSHEPVPRDRGGEAGPGLDDELALRPPFDVAGPLVVFAAETGLRTNEWAALERRDVDKAGRAGTVQRRVADGSSPDTRRRSGHAAGAAERASARGARPHPRSSRYPSHVPGSGGRLHRAHTWRTREWYPALEAGIARRGPYHLRHTFATEALAASVSMFELARMMGTSLQHGRA